MEACCTHEEEVNSFLKLFLHLFFSNVCIFLLGSGIFVKEVLSVNYQKQCLCKFPSACSCIFALKAFEGNCLALEQTFADVHSSVSNWGRDGVSGQQTPSVWKRGHPRPSLFCILPSCFPSGRVKSARGLFTVCLQNGIIILVTNSQSMWLQHPPAGGRLSPGYECSQVAPNCLQDSRGEIFD